MNSTVDPEQQRSGATNDLLEKLALGCRILGKEGAALGAYGHLSARDPDTGMILIKARGRHEEGMEFATAADFAAIALDGSSASAPYGLKVPNEVHIHLGIYRARPEVNSVVHSHPANIVALTAVAKPLLPLYGSYHPPGLMMALEGIPTYPSSRLIDSAELGDEVAALMGDRVACLLRGHGAVTAGKSIEDAVMSALALNELASINCLAYSMGSPEPVPQPDMDFFKKRFAAVAPGNLVRDDGRRSDWYYYTRRCNCV